MVMKAVVVYDSKFGNTESLARTIAGRLGMDEPALVVAATVATEADLAGTDLLVVGGPTQGHGISSALRAFLARLPDDAVRDIAAATFDTRLGWPKVLSGSAAAGSARRLTKKGARLVMPPGSFVVKASEGPLADGEVDRAMNWADGVWSKVAGAQATSAGYTAR
jgi:flavodoxin